MTTGVVMAIGSGSLLGITTGAVIATASAYFVRETNTNLNIFLLTRIRKNIVKSTIFSNHFLLTFQFYEGGHNNYFFYKRVVIN